MKLDLKFVRAQFPAFEERSLKDQHFFENAGGSYTCAPVIKRLVRFYTERKVQPYGPYDASRVAGEEMDEARIRLAALLGVETDELSFGPSTTQNTYVLSQAFGQYLKPGDAIIVTNQDHEANSGPWRRLAERGIEIREWKVDHDSGQLDHKTLDNLLDNKVKLVVFPHCSNIVAEINDVKSITAKVHAAGALVCVDGVSYAPHGFPNVADLGADFYLFSSYKTYGPHQGIMVVRRSVGKKLPNQGHWFNGDCLYKRFTPAGPDHAQIAACAGMVDYYDALYAHHFDTHAEPAGRAAAIHDLMRAHESELLQPLLDYIDSRNSMALIGSTDATSRAPTVAVNTGGDAQAVAAALAPHGIMAGGGDFYGARPLEGMGIDPKQGVLRLSFVHYTTKAEIDHLIRALDHVL